MTSRQVFGPAVVRWTFSFKLSRGGTIPGFYLAQMEGPVVDETTDPDLHDSVTMDPRPDVYKVLGQT